MHDSGAWHRNPNREVLPKLGVDPKAAGTLSLEKENLSDILWGYPLTAGVDYALTEVVFLGVKVRYVDPLTDFMDGDT